MDSSQPWLLYWTLTSLDLLGVDVRMQALPLDLQQGIAKLLLSCQVSSNRAIYDSNTVESTGIHAFGGGPGQLPNMACTFASMACLAILQDHSLMHQLGLDQEECIDGMMQWIRDRMVEAGSDGSCCIHEDGERDVRSTYCAIAIWYMMAKDTRGAMDGRYGRDTEDGHCTDDTVCGDNKMHLDSLPHLLRTKTPQFLKSCYMASMDGGIGPIPGVESHAGYGFCTVAVAHLLGVDAFGCEEQSISYQRLIEWTSQRQIPYYDSREQDDQVSTDVSRAFQESTAVSHGFFGSSTGSSAGQSSGQSLGSSTGPSYESIDVPFTSSVSQVFPCVVPAGFQGRTNKLVDGCYSYWVGAMATMLRVPFNRESLITFILSCCQEDPTEEGENSSDSEPVISGGGFRDRPGSAPDLYHTCYCLCGLALLGCTVPCEGMDSDRVHPDAESVQSDSVPCEGDHSDSLKSDSVNVYQSNAVPSIALRMRPECIPVSLSGSFVYSVPRINEAIALRQDNLNWIRSYFSQDNRRE